jgi:phage baseplate assembly protein W
MRENLSIPLRKGARGLFATTSSEEQSIEENLRQICFVNPTERMYRIDIGVPLSAMVWDPADDVFFSIIKLYLRKQILQFEDRIQLQSIIVSREENPDDGSMAVMVDIQYKISSSGRVRSLSTGGIFTR